MRHKRTCSRVEFFFFATANVIGRKKLEKQRKTNKKKLAMKIKERKMITKTNFSGAV